jgi:CelD/BcsL family acetyltransferase involved in cellulose biosynthesis
MIAANHSAKFLREVSCRLADAGMLRIFSLKYNGDIAAVILAMRKQTTIFGYLTGFDPNHDRFGIGRILLYESIRHAIESGFHRWDFLRGDEPYKRSWGAEKLDKIRLIVTRKT